MDRVSHILLVDDEPEFLFSAAIGLRVAGFRVTVSSNGAEALDAMEKAMEGTTPVDLMVTDLVMQGMGGMELIVAVRKRWSSLPILIVTGFFDKSLEREIETQGCQGHILKPFRSEEFVGRIKGILREASGAASPAASPSE